MLQSKGFIKKTKKGKILKVVKEHYLRDDIYCGSPLAAPEHRGPDPAAWKLAPEAAQYLVVDTNVALHQMDFLEAPAVRNVVVCSKVMEEVRHKNVSAYNRLRQLCAREDKRFFVFSNEHHRDTYVKAEPGESPNDRNDRAIRVAAAWYQKVVPGMEIVVLTDDNDNRRKAEASGLKALSVRAFAASQKDQPELMDLVAAYGGRGDAGEAGEAAGGGGGGGGDGGRSNKKQKRSKVYEDHRPMSEITAGLKGGRYHQGCLRVSRFNPFEGWVASDAVGDDILLSGREAMNRAVDGDVVAVELLEESQWRAESDTLPQGIAAGGDAGEDGGEGEVDAAIAQVAPGEHYGDLTGSVGKKPTGRVVGIIQRNWRSRGYCGSLMPPGPNSRRLGAGQNHVLFVPVERKFPRIRIQTRQAEHLMDKRLVVAIDGWDADSDYPSGHYVRTLGTIGDKETETEVLVIENDVNTAPFTVAVHECVPPLPWEVTDADREDPNRRDLRDLAVMSVDPPGCRDIDDALHVRKLPNGNLEVGVHIADVTNFVQSGAPIDLEASRRGTSVYLVGKRIDMLPKPLTEDICSLRCHVERLAFSVLWEMTPEADVVDVTYTKSIIKSRAALSYLEAQTRMDDPKMKDPLTEDLREMNRIARILRARRAEAGALSLASPEVRFELDTETHDPMDVGMYQVKEANQMVEEMMLLANCTVAGKIVAHFASCAMLRRHPTPAPRMFDPLLRAAASVGVKIDPSSSKALADSLDRAQRADPYFNKLIRIMATRCMTQAVYFGSGELAPPEYHHYGLAAPLYTHFTSPIRRYADVIVHRLLAAAIGLIPLPEGLRDKAGLKALTTELNYRHKNAQMAGRASVELHTLIFFRNRTVVADARITKVRKNGVIVFVPKYGIEGPVYFSPRSEDDRGGGAGRGKAAEDTGDWALDEEAQTVRSASSGVQYKTFDQVAVRIVVEKLQSHRQRLSLTMAHGEEPEELATV